MGALFDAIKEDPAIPLGLTATVSALGWGFYSYRCQGSTSAFSAQPHKMSTMLSYLVLDGLGVVTGLTVFPLVPINIHHTRSHSPNARKRRRIFLVAWPNVDEYMFTIFVLPGATIVVAIACLVLGIAHHTYRKPLLRAQRNGQLDTLLNEAVRVLLRWIAFSPTFRRQHTPNSDDSASERPTGRARRSCRRGTTTSGTAPRLTAARCVPRVSFRASQVAFLAPERV